MSFINLHKHNYKLSNEDIAFLEGNGFIQDNSRNSGYHFLEEEDRVIVVITYFNNRFKLEFYSILQESDGTHYTDFSKEFSNENETLEEFIKRYI